MIATVAELGSETSSLRVGDLVLCLQAGKFDSSMIANVESCHLLTSADKADELCGAFVPFCTALLAVNQVGKVRAGEVC